MSKGIILLIDDEPEKLFLFSEILLKKGYQVITARDGREGLKSIQTVKPNLILLDISMPEMKGHSVLENIRKDPEIGHLPVIILTASDRLDDKLIDLQIGADDYISKMVHPEELNARIEMVLRRYKMSYDANPLTRLPGNTAIEEEIQRRIIQQTLFAVGYVDIDNFKAFNDFYGFKEGDRIIQFTAKILVDVVKTSGSERDFAGHIGGDDFVFITTALGMEPIAKDMIHRFDTQVPTFYRPSDLERGYIEVKNRQGQLDRFPIVSLSIAIVTNQHRSFESVSEVAQVAADLKKYLKSLPGSNYSVDKRTS
jgi:diguanylate cyclase (GGDEF)-like protein